MDLLPHRLPDPFNRIFILFCCIHLLLSERGGNTKRFIAMASLLVFCVAMFVVPASAVSNSDILPVTANDPETIVSNGVLGTTSTDSRNTYNYYYSASISGVYGAFIGTRGDPYFITPDDTAYVYGAQVRQSDNDIFTHAQRINGWHDSQTGLAYHTFGNGAFQDMNGPKYFTHYDTIREALDAIANYEPVVPGSAVLVDDGINFSWCSGYSFNNNSGVDVATAFYNLGHNDIVVIASRESNLVLPGYIDGSATNFTLSSFNRVPGAAVYYSVHIIENGSVVGLNPYEDLDSALAGCYSVLGESENAGGGYVPADTQFTLQPGNCAFIILSDFDDDITLSATFDRNSSLIASNGSYFPGNILYKFGASYPQSGDTLPGTGCFQVPWQKNEWGSSNLYGQTKNAIAHISGSQNMLMIYNPTYSADDTGSSYPNGNRNPSITITSSSISRNGIRVYQLKDSFSATDPDGYYGISSDSPSDYNDYSQSTNNPSADNPDVTGWTDQSGNTTTAPGASPYNELQQSDTISDVLNNFMSNITGLFTEGHNAIRNLTSGASEFVGQLSGLYSWLPAPVLSILTSAIILAIIIGVLKVFL